MWRWGLATDNPGLARYPRNIAPATLGIALGASAYSLFSVHDAGIKWLVQTLPVWEIIFFRSLVIVLISLGFGRARLAVRAITTPMKWPLTLRGGLTFAAWLCYFTAARSLPLGQLTVLYFAAPIVVIVLARPLLGERVTLFRGVAVAVGFTGVMIAAAPGDMAVGLPTLLALAAAGMWGYGIILMRQVARRETSLLQMLFVNVVFTLASGVMCVFEWRMPDAPRLGLMLGLGVVGGLAQFLLFESARRAPAAVMATVEYTALLWAFLLGFLLWGEIPGAPVFLGAGLILGAGLLLVVAEQRSSRLPKKAERARDGGTPHLGPVARKDLP